MLRKIFHWICGTCMVLLFAMFAEIYVTHFHGRQGFIAWIHYNAEAFVNALFISLAVYCFVLYVRLSRKEREG